MLELYIPVVKSVVSMDNGAGPCEVEPQPFRVTLKDDSRDREVRVVEFNSEENRNYSIDDDLWPEGCGMERTPSLLQPHWRNRGWGESREERQYRAFLDGDENNYMALEYRGDAGQQKRYEDSFGHDDWEVDRPAMRQQQQQSRRCEDPEEQDERDLPLRKSDAPGSKALQSCGAMKKITICELLKARKRNKTKKKALQALADLKQSMGTKMNGSFFQRSGQGQQEGQYGTRKCGGKGNEAKDEYETFVMSLIPELKKLDDQQMRQFKWKVFQLIDDISADGSESNSGFDKRGNASSGKPMNRFESHQSESIVMYENQVQCAQDQTAGLLLMDQCSDKGDQWWDSEQNREKSHQTHQQQRYPQQRIQHYQQSNHPYMPQQHQQQWQQHQGCEPTPRCQPHCEPPESRQPHCHPQPPCQPCCEPLPPCCEPQPSRESQQGSNRQSQQGSNRQSQQGSNRQSQQGSNRQSQQGSNRQSHTSHTSARSTSVGHEKSPSPPPRRSRTYE